MSYTNTKLVVNNSTLFDNITFGLTFMNDTECRTELARHYRLQEIIFPVDDQKIFIQDVADNTKDYLNRLAVLKGKTSDYNPIENYDMTETETPAEITETVRPAATTVTHTPAETTETYTPAEGTVSSANSTYGFNSSSSVPLSTASSNNTVQDPATTAIDVDTAGTEVLTVQTAGTRVITVQEERTLTRKGNIGVQTAGQMLTIEAGLAKVLFSLREEFIRCYEDLFHITLDLEVSE